MLVLEKFLFHLIIMLFVPLVCLGQPVFDTLVLPKVLVSAMDSMNTAHSEFSPGYIENSLVYVKEKKNDEKKALYYDLAVAKYASSDERLASRLEIMNSGGHEGPFVWDGASGIIYFTQVSTVVHPRTQQLKSLRQIMQHVPGEGNVTRWEHSTTEAHTCHPAINARGDILIFSSDRVTRGDMDLYYSVRKGDSWGEPIPMPTTLNTSSHEFFPTFHGDSILTFSSNRAGSMDMFYTQLTEDGWSQARLLPPPFNSMGDDIGLVIDAEGKSGYFSSNRRGGKGSDDIYRWTSDVSIMYDPKRYQSTLEVNVVEKLGFAPIADAVVDMYPIENTSDMLLAGTSQDGAILLRLKPENIDAAYSARSDRAGRVVLDYSTKSKYLVTVSASGMSTYSWILKKGSKSVTATLDPLSSEIEKNVETTSVESQTEDTAPLKKGKVLVFDKIYYEYNSSKIRKGAASELDHLATIMRKHPSIIIQLSAHTDSRGPASYNQSLSEKRALAAKRYLEAQGVASHQIRVVGYGESRLRNHCADGKRCSEADHAHNRRTEVLILSE